MTDPNATLAEEIGAAETAITDSPAMTYGRLKIKHPSYAENELWWKELDLLYKGGHALAVHREEFLPRLVNELPVRYEERCKSAGYINYLAQIIDYFAGALFDDALTLTPATDADNPDTVGTESAVPEVYKEFERDADLRRTPFVGLLKEITTNALIKKWSWLALDLPRSTEQAASLADERARGQLRPYSYEVLCEGVLDWKESSTGSLEWAILHRCLNERDTPKGDRTTITEEFTI